MANNQILKLKVCNREKAMNLLKKIILFLKYRKRAKQAYDDKMAMILAENLMFPTEAMINNTLEMFKQFHANGLADYPCLCQDYNTEEQDLIVWEEL